MLAFDTLITSGTEISTINVRQTTWWNRNCEIRHSIDADSIFKSESIRLFVCKDTTTRNFTAKDLPLLPPPAQVSSCTTIVNCPPMISAPACCPSDTSYSRNSVGPAVKSSSNSKDGGLRVGLIFVTSNRFAKKGSADQNWWNEKFSQVDGYVLPTVGVQSPIAEVVCDTCFILVPDKKEINLEIEPGFKIRFGNQGALLHPFLGGSIPIRWSPSQHHFSVVPTVEVGVIMGLRKGFPQNKGFHLIVSGTYNKYGFGGKFTAMYLFSVDKKPGK